MAFGFQVRNQKDFAAGLLYIAFGAAFSAGALQYKLGDPARMGPGWFPFWVGVLLALVGAIVAAQAVRRRATEERIQKPDLRAMAWILGAVVLFGLLLPKAGLVIALAALVLVASRGSHEFRWGSTLASAVLLICFSVGVFIYGINLQIPLWPLGLR
jgi:hypothetical protein